MKTFLDFFSNLWDVLDHLKGVEKMAENTVRVTFTLNREAHEQLKGLANRKGCSMAHIFREALRREVWLESISGSDHQELLIRDERHPDELEKVLCI